MTSLGRTLLLCAALMYTGLLSAACSPADPPASSASSAGAAEASKAAKAPSAPEARDASSAPRIVVLGDSLTAGLGLEPHQAYPALLQKRLEAAGLRYEVVNAGVSGDTTAGGLRRLDWSIAGDTRVLIVALGGNDGLRGLPVAETRRNLDEIIRRARQRGIAVVLAGMEAPPNYGATYTTEFRAVFRDLARQHDVTFIPFLLEGVAGIADMNQRDGIHPNPEGARVVERLVWTALEPIVESPAAR